MASNETSKYKLSVVEGTELQLSVNTGVQGPAGPIGPAGDDALWNYTAAYDSGASYAIGDLVTYEGQLFYRTDANGGNVGDTPSEGSNFWDLIAAKGTDASDLPVVQWFPPNPEPVSQNVVALEIVASGDVTEGQPIPEDINVIITFDNPSDNPISYTLTLTEGTVFNSTTIAATLASGLDNEIELLGTQQNTVYSYNNFVAVNVGTSNFDTLIYTTLTCNYGTASAPASVGTDGVIQYCTFVPVAVGQFIFEAYSGGRQWVCSNVNPIIWTEITKEVPITLSSSTDILTLGGTNNFTFSLAFGDGITFDDSTNTISCNTNIARRAGNQTFTGNNTYGTSIAPVVTTFFGTQTFNGGRTLAGTSTFSGQVELTGQAATNSTSAINRVLGDARYRGVYSTTSVATQSSSDVLASTLSITLPVGIYELSAFIASSHTSIAGCQIRLGTTHNIKVGLTDNYGRPSTAAFSEAIIAEDYNNSNILATRADTGGTAYRRTITGVIEVITPSTVISLDYAQAVTTPANPSTARARRYLVARPIG